MTFIIGKIIIRIISLYNLWKDGEILQKKIMKDYKMSRTTLHKHIIRLKKEGRIS
ncbi:MAG: hypothetical protein IKE77_10105 [Erysipelotrichaceae bacterium]|nr:hypothetical protein [Erysipelotrichaceae bacterium]